MKSKIFYGWWIVFACFMISLYVGSSAFYSFTAFFKPIADELKWSYTTISFASSLRGLEMGLLAPLVGFLVYRFGSRRLIFSGIIIVGMGIILLSRAHNIYMFYASFLLISLGSSGCTNVSNMSVVANWFKKNSGKALGVMSTGFGCSSLLIVPIVMLIDSYGWRNTLVILGVGMWVFGIPLALIIRNNPEPYGYLPDGEESSPTEKEIDEQKEQADLPFMKAYKDRSFLLITLSESIRFLVLSAVILHIMPFLSSVGASRFLGALTTTGIPLFSIPGRFMFGALGDRYDKRHIMTLAYACMAIGIFFLNYANNPFSLALFIFLFPPGYGGLAVLRGSFLREYYGRDLFPKMIGIMLGFSSIGGIIGPTLTGRVFDIFGSYHYIWLVYSGLLFASIVLIIRIKPKKRNAN